jgi:copper chaperone CopZ
MRCNGCRAVVEDALKEVAGIYRTEVDVRGQSVRVLYNPACALLLRPFVQ